MAVKLPGPPPIPNEVKRRRGNPGKRSLPKESGLTILPGRRDAPEPPLPLDTRGRALWDLAWSEACSWLAPTDTMLLAVLCQAIDEREVVREAALAGDRLDRVAMRQIDRQITDQLQLLGFSPADRTRLGVGEVRLPEDDLAAFRRQA